MPRICTAFLLALGLFPFGVIAQEHNSTPGNHRFKHVGIPIMTTYTNEQHGGGSQLWCSYQTENTIMYFCTNDGLIRWDGEKFSHFDSDNKTRVRDIVKWKDGQLYVTGVNDFGFYQQDASGDLEYVSLKTFFDDDIKDIGEVWALGANSEQVVFATIYGNYSWNGERVQQVSMNGQPSGAQIFSVDDQLIFRHRKSESFYRIVNPESPTVEKLDWQFNNGDDPFTNIRSMFTNAAGNPVMVTSWDGVFELRDGIFEPVLKPEGRFGKTQFYHGMQSTDGLYYLTTINQGLYILNQAYEVVQNYQAEDGLGSNVVLHANEDHQNNIWLTGAPNIIVMQAPHMRSELISSPQISDISGIKVINDQLYVFGRGLYKLQSSSSGEAAIFTSAIDFEHKIFDINQVGEQVLLGNEAGLHSLDISSNSELTNLEHVFEGTNVFNISTDPSSNTVYATEQGGIIRLTRQKGAWSSQLIASEKVLYSQVETELSSNGEMQALWVTTDDKRIFRFEDIDAEGNIGITTEFDTVENGLGTDNLQLFSINNEVLIGTENGTFILAPEDSAKLKKKQDWPQKLNTKGVDVFLLEEDEQGRIWYRAGNDMGLAYKDENGKWIEVEASIMPYDRFGVRGFTYFDNAIWLAAITNRFFRLSEQSIHALPDLGKLFFQSVQTISDQKVIGSVVDGVLQDDITQQSNSIRINYSLLDYSAPVDTTYRTRISGEDTQNWTPWSTESYKDFPLLAGGNYTFDVEATDPWGRVSSTSLDFYVVPPWYLSTTAWIIYQVSAVVILAITAWLSQRWRTRRLKAQNLNLEQTVQERTKEVEAKVEELREQQILKDRFFANVSHEFRTPLTLTIGPLQSIKDEYQNDTAKPVLGMIDTALSNARKMMALVGQVLDLNRLEAGKLPLRVSKYDVADLLQQLKRRFEPWALQHQQAIKLEDCDEPLMLWCDPDQIDKCLSNLLSNAIKYSGDGSDISLSILHEGERVGLVVRDNGVGISADAQQRVFDRFYQDKSSENVSEPGTGIGLALVKEIIELHHGQVQLNSETGQGCEFVLWLNKSKAHFNEEQLAEFIYQPEPSNTSSQESTSPSSDENDKTTLLIVDDNQELLNFISLRLSANYRILQAHNGEEAFALACNTLPDLIISDVMMPVMNGLELTQRLKLTPATRTIPVILLTAKATKRETVEGFSSGADDYLTKPFDTSELIMRVNAQIQARKVIRNSLSFDSTAEALNVAQKTPFVEQLNQHIQTNISKPEFNVARLADLMNMSRDTLTRKCKKELDLSPLAYIRQLRMHQAGILLQENKISVSEIAYGLGFESLHYFSRTFKQHTGKSPTEFASAPT